MNFLYVALWDTTIIHSCWNRVPEWILNVEEIEENCDRL
jgi:hypothetical protein